jgi:hypothetical protein
MAYWIYSLGLHLGAKSATDLFGCRLDVSDGGRHGRCPNGRLSARSMRASFAIVRSGGLVVVEVGVEALPASAFSRDGLDHTGLGVAAEK